MICTICKEEYVNQSELDPAEPCLCGQMAWGTPWDWDGFRGLKNWVRYQIAAFCFEQGNKIIMGGYK